jgi:hypothetical protein
VDAQGILAGTKRQGGSLAIVIKFMKLSVPGALLHRSNSPVNARQ